MNMKKYPRCSKKHPIKDCYTLDEKTKESMKVVGGLTIKDVWTKNKEI